MKYSTILKLATGFCVALLLTRMAPDIATTPSDMDYRWVVLALLIIAGSSAHSLYLRYRPESQGIALLMLIQLILPLPLALVGYQQPTHGYIFPLFFGFIGVYVEFFTLGVLFLFVNFKLIRQSNEPS